MYLLEDMGNVKYMLAILYAHALLARACTHDVVGLLVTCRIYNSNACTAMEHSI